MVVLFFIPILATAQLPSGVVWDSAVGCQEATIEYGFDVEDGGECIKACEYSTVTYTLVGGIPARWIDVDWQVVGGNIQSSSNTAATVDWGSQGWGVILVEIETLDGVFTREICVEIVPSSSALFNIAPNQHPAEGAIEICKDALIYFENLSQTNGGSPLVSYNWHFSDDDTTSAEFEPTHVFPVPGSYMVTLTVTNDCNCSDSFEMLIEVLEEPGLQIVCNGIACENGLETYTAINGEGDPMEGCGHWAATGGDVQNQYGANADVHWNAVDQDGFGYLTFYPEECEVECARPVTIKVPVIIDDVEIDGPEKICEGEQFRYSIPQWPSTEVEWKTSPAGALLFPSDQPNEIVFLASNAGNYVLEAIYTNTLKGCGGSALKEIQVIPTVNIQGPTKLCVGDNEFFTNSDGLTVNWVLEGPSGVHTGAGTSFSHTFTVPGTYSLSLGQDGFCLNPVHPILVSPKPDAPTAIDGPLEVCLGTPIIYSVDPPPGSAIAIWSISTGHGVFASTGTRHATGEEVTVVWDPTPSNPSIPYMLRVTYIKNGCSSDTEVITVVPLNTNFNFTGAQTACSSSYETYSVGYTEGDKYEWSISPAYLGSVAEYPQDGEVEILWNDVGAPTQATIEVEIKKCGSTHTLTYPVTVVNAPQIGIVAPTTVCRDEPVNFDISGLSSWDTITWDFGDGTIVSNTTAPAHIYDDINTGNVNYTVTVTVEGPNGCVNNSTDTFVVQVQPKPVAHITSPDSLILCAPADFSSNPATLNLNISPGYPAPANIQWFFNGSPLSTPPPHTSAVATQAGDYWAELTSANGCTITTGITLRIDNCSGNPGAGCAPNGSINTLTAQMTACGTATATVSYSGTPISHDWAVGGPSGSISNQTATTADFSFTEAGLHSIFYYATFNGTDANGDPCTDELYRSFNIDVPYIAGLTYTVSCGSTAGTYDVTLYDDSGFVQPIQNFNFKVNGTSVGTSGPVTVSLAPGPHTLELEISSPGFFPCTAILPINLPALPSVQINGPSQACAGTPVQFTATVNDPNLQYDWDFDDFALNSLPDPIRTFDNSKPFYNVTLIVTNRFGCKAIAQYPIDIYGGDFKGNLSLNPSTTCYGNPITITYIPTQGGSISNYIWHREVDGTVISTVQTSQPMLLVTEPGLYILDVESGSTLNCLVENVARINVSFLETPVAKIIGPHQVCDAPFRLYASPVYGDDYQYTWKRDGQVLSAWNDEPEIDQDLPPGTYNYELSVVSLAGCADTATFQVEVFPSPGPPAVSMQSISCDPYIYELTATHPDQGTFVWSNGQSGPVINVGHGGPYRVSFFSQQGCPSSFEVDVPQNAEAYIWVAPEGCYEICETFISDYYLSGPVFPMDYWEWQLNGGGGPIGTWPGTGGGSTLSSGTGQVADQYWAGDGLYQLTLGSGPCAVTSKGMEWNMAPEGCEGWCEISVEIEGIEPSVDMYGNCYYILHIVFINNDPPFSYTLDNLTNNGVIVPGGGVLPNGNTPAQLEFYPPAGFAGGMVDFRVLLELLQEEHPNCAIEFSVNFPPCPPGSSRPANLGIDKNPIENGFTAMPNPTNGTLNIGYDLQDLGKGAYSLHLYDLSGREIHTERLDASGGKKTFDLHGQSDGLYLIILRRDGKPLGYKKIVLKK